MKTSVYLIFALFLLAVVLPSCHKEHLDPSLIVATEDFRTEGSHVSQAVHQLIYKDKRLSLRQGRLVFESKEDAAYFEQEMVLNGEALRDWIDQLPDFTSSEEAYLSVDEEAYELAGRNLDYFAGYAYLDGDVLMPVVDDPAWAHLANGEGVFQVGGTVYKIFRDEAIGLDEAHYLQGEIGYFGESASVEVIPILRVSVRPIDEVVLRGTVADCETSYSGGDARKIKGRVREQSPLFSSTVNCIADTRTFNGWFTKKVSRVEQVGCLSVNGNFGFCFSVDASSNNSSKAEKVFFSGSGASVNLFQGSTVRHTAIDPGPRNCFTQP